MRDIAEQLAKEHATVFQDTGLTKIYGGRLVAPGERWGEFTEAFADEDLTRSSQVVGLLGRVAGTAALEPLIVQDSFSFERTIERFADTARPPIQEEEMVTFKNAAMLAFSSSERVQAIGAAA